MDAFQKNADGFTELEASSLAVGLPEGLMGNSEVGHLNIGAGRVVWQDVVRIDQTIKKGELDQNEVIMETFKKAKAGTGRLHLAGLISDGGVVCFPRIETGREELTFWISMQSKTTSMLY
jgi:2,3-bisphosphoglycerate-independent phosphoglycerate mutase